MADYSRHIQLLVFVFTVLIGLFLIAAIFEWERFWKPLVFTIAVTMILVLVLARFGGDLGRSA
jgi:uncharacterized membrane protein